MNKKVVLRHLLLLGVLAGVLCFFWLTGIGCPFRALFHKPCPACGATRALSRLFAGDMTGYFFYHPLAVPLVAAGLVGIHRDRLPLLKKRGFTAFLYLTAAAAFVLYLARFPLIP